jgi:carbonic anhydrase
MKSKYKAMVLSCIDPRFQPLIFEFLKKKKLTGKYSAFTIAGGSIGVTHKKFKKWHKTFFDNLTTSIFLHKIEKIIIINHNDCGAAKIANGNKRYDEKKEIKIHINSFITIRKNIKKKFPKLKIDLYLMNIDKKIKKFNRILL